MHQYRQGDVLITRITTDLTEDQRKIAARDVLTLALGEATGHSHTIECRGGTITEEQTIDGLLVKWMSLPSESELKHQEHNPVTLPPGNYKVTRQREYTPSGYRNVAD